MSEEKIKIQDTFPIGEAFIDCIYGKIRQGKTYTGAALAWWYLKQGNVVKTSWPIKFSGYNEKNIWWKRLLGRLGLKKYFFVVPKENLEYIQINGKNLVECTTEEFYHWFEKQTDCIILIDEAQWVFDSYLKTAMEKSGRMAVFATGHFNRAVKVIVQRPMQIHISLRGNIARYFKVEKIFNGWWFIPKRFRLTEFQELKTTDAVPDETIDEESGEYVNAESTEYFWLNKEIAESYDSKYLRGGMKSSQENLAYWLKIKWSEWFKKK